MFSVFLVLGWGWGAPYSISHIKLIFLCTRVVGLVHRGWFPFPREIAPLFSAGLRRLSPPLLYLPVVLSWTVFFFFFFCPLSGLIPCANPAPPATPHARMHSSLPPTFGFIVASFFALQLLLLRFARCCCQDGAVIVHYYLVVGRSLETGTHALRNEIIPFAPRDESRLPTFRACCNTFRIACNISAIRHTIACRTEPSTDVRENNSLVAAEAPNAGPDKNRMLVLCACVYSIRTLSAAFFFCAI